MTAQRPPSQRLALLSLLAVCLPMTAPAQFMDLRNEATLARGFGLPAVGRGTLVGTQRWQFSLDLSNEYHLGDDGGETLLLDGETARYALSYARRVGERFELGFELPFLHQSGGFLDAPIEQWHDWFSLPNGGREETPQNRYRFFYADGERELLDVGESGTRPGELRLLGGWALSSDKALRLSVKLPSGDAETLAGNEAWSAALWLDSAWRRGEWSGYVSAGGLYAARGEVLPDPQRRWTALGGIGLGWQAWPGLRLLAQLNAHTPLYEGVDEVALKRPGVQLAAGCAVRIGDGRELFVGFQEDLSVASSPDFSLHLALRFE